MSPNSGMTALFSGESLWVLARILIPFLLIFNLIPAIVWLERKTAAFIQDRPGPNRAEILGIRLGGMLHSIADFLKLVSKKDVIPQHVNKVLFILAPAISLFVASVTFVVIPFADTLVLEGRTIAVQAAPAPIGFLYILSMTSLGVYGIILAGWASNNKFALLGGLRSSAQLISYEIGMGLSLMGVFMITGSLELGDIVRSQTAYPWQWNIIRQPLACMLFIICAFAETNRSPFDLPEGESEIVAGYHVEYSSMKFAMFFMAEYANMIVASCVIATLFLGGWQVPFLPTELLRTSGNGIAYGVFIAAGILMALLGLSLLFKYRPNHYGDRRDYEVLVFGFPLLGIGILTAGITLIHGPFHWGTVGVQAFAAALQIGTILLKTLLVCFFFILVRWTVPRFRYDQLMNLGWRGIIPLGIGNTIITAVVLYGLHAGRTPL